MTAEQFNLAVLMLCIIAGPPFLYHGYRLVTDKKYYMQIMEGYLGENVDQEYEKLSMFHRQYRRYKTGYTALAAGTFLLVLLGWMTFFRDN